MKAVIRNSPSKNEKGLAVNHKLLSAVLCTQVRQIGSECRAQLTEKETQYERNATMFLNSCRSGRCLEIERLGKMQRRQRDALGSPVGGGASSTVPGGPSNSVRTGFNASAQI